MAFDPELECIIDFDTGMFHLFDFDSFDDFVDVLNAIIYFLTLGLTDKSGDSYVCIDPQEAIGIESCF